MSLATAIWLSGPVLRARPQGPFRLREAVTVGPERLLGEVIRIAREEILVQVYEDTSGLRPGVEVQGMERLLSIRLGPGILGNIFDGLLRPIGDPQEPYVAPGMRDLPAASFGFRPMVDVGGDLTPGGSLGEVENGTGTVQRCLVPPDLPAGKVVEIAESGGYREDEVVCRLRDRSGGIHDLAMGHRWPVRIPRPVTKRLPSDEPMLTGQRILDCLFPVAKGGTAAIPGGFGTGKTVLLETIAKWCDADVIVYVGCGERGNEMAGLLEELAELEDPRSGRRLLERTVVIANTSNMPVSAREASIYTGITVAEYFRDQGLNVTLMADSTSRWAEALREVSGRLGELPGESGHPAYLSSRLADFYERAARVRTLGGEVGAVTVLGAVSPPSGDFSEPVTMHTKRYVGCLWALDARRAHARFFPAIHPLQSYSQVAGGLARWWHARGCTRWEDLRRRFLTLLEEEASLERMARIIGRDAMPGRQRLVLLCAQLVSQAFLRQSAFSQIDRHATPERQAAMMRLIGSFIEGAERLLEAGIAPEEIGGTPVFRSLMRMGEEIPEGAWEGFAALDRELASTLTTRLGERAGCLGFRRPGSGAGIHAAAVAVARTGRVSMYARLIGENIAERADGPLLFLRRTLDVGLNEAVEVEGTDGRVRLGRVAALDEESIALEVLDDTAGLALEGTRVRFFGEPLCFRVGPGLLGRVFNGVGRPLDGGPPVAAQHTLRVDGRPLKPSAREAPNEFLETGFTAIDLMNSLIRGQKLPLFSGGGLPHERIAVDIACNARLPRGAEEEDFAIVFAGIGIPNESAELFREEMEKSGALARTVLFLNLASDSSAQRLLAPRFALTAAEYLAFTEGKHVLAILTDMTNYCEALREVSASRGEIPSRKGYPGYMYSDLATLFERAGRIRGIKGSVTQVPILTMPSDDITHPIPDLTGYITEGQIVLDRELHRRDLYPPIRVLPSLSRLMKDGTGAGTTHADHPALAAQLYAAYAQARQTRILASVVGEEGLSAVDRQFLAFATVFERDVVSHPERRSLEESMEAGWTALRRLPKTELHRLNDRQIEAHLVVD